MNEENYERMPASIRVREIRVQVRQPGYRIESFVAVTTLLEAEEYPKDDVASLYESRWLAELDIRAIKITVGMEILRCKTPEMVRKEMWMCLLAYNLVRRSVLQAALEAGVSPRTLSFTAALQTIGASWVVIVLSDDALASLLIDAAMATIAAHVVGNRPGRVEPRAIKRRPKEHAYLSKPHNETRAKLLREKSM